MDELLKTQANYILTRPGGDSRPLNMGKAAYTAIVCVFESTDGSRVSQLWLISDIWIR